MLDSSAMSLEVQTHTTPKLARSGKEGYTYERRQPNSPDFYIPTYHVSNMRPFEDTHLPYRPYFTGFTLTPK